MRTFPYVRWFIFALLAMLMLVNPATSSAQVAVGITVGFAPPDLPVYEQPICPGDGYIWTPGYWAWDDDYGDYYWVPGTWVLAPEPGYLWTPAYWGWGGSGFIFYAGYWSFGVVGFYGGIDYGYGYFGRGYEGGRWQGDRFYYNRSVNNVSVTEIRNVYEQPVNHREERRVSYNGGNGGINARPTPQEEAAARGRRLPPAAGQNEQMQQARSNPQFRANVNHGKPPVAATSRPGAFSGGGVVPAREGGTVHGGPRNAGPANAGRNNMPPENNTRRAVHPNDLPPLERPGASSAGNSKQEQKYEKQQQKMYAQQEKDRQKLQQRQEKEHQQLAKQNANDARKQQVEQRHQQQTEQLQQRHSQQQQRMQQRQPQSHSAPPPPPPREKH
jgi:hypothetical protein